MIVLSSVDRRTKLGTLVLDVLLTEEIDLASQISEYPVEDGTIISDHITKSAEKIRIGGMISTADVAGGQGTAAAFGFGADNSTKLVDVVETARKMHEARAIVEISTGQLVYKDFAFSSLNLSRSSDGVGGNWLSIKGELTKITKVKLKTADVPPPENVPSPTSGRAGETNKAAGRSTPSSAGANSPANSSANTYGPSPSARDNTTAMNIRNGVRTEGSQINNGYKLMRGALGL